MFNDVIAINNIESKRDNSLAFFICMQIFLPAIKFVIVQSIPGLVVYNTISNYALGIIFLFLFLLNIKTILKRSLGVFCVSVVCLLTLYMSAFLSGEPNKQNAIDASIDIFIISFPLFLASFSLRDSKILFNKMCLFAPYVVLCCLLMVINTFVFGVVGVTQSSFTSTYNMSLSYFCLVPTIVCFCKGQKTRHFINYFLFLIGVFVIFIMGSRGPLLCIAIFLLVYFIHNFKLSLKSILFFAALCSFVLIVFINLDSILTSLSNSVLFSRVNSRTLVKIIHGTIADDSNRFLIIQNAFSLIKSNPLGIGFMGNLRTHNVLIENILWFGLFIGVIFGAIFIYMVFKGVFINSNIKNVRELTILIFYAYAIPDALLNLTIWGKDYFWICFGLMLNLVVSKRKIAVVQRYSVENGRIIAL